jgi:uncharacterized membrane protein YraQ (UPF0718 family)
MKISYARGTLHAAWTDAYRQLRRCLDAWEEKMRRVHVDWSLLAVTILSGLAAFHVLQRDGVQAALAILHEDAVLFLSILPKVIAGTLIAVLVQMLVARESVVRFVGAGSGLRGLLLAMLVGMIFPGGPFAIFPLAASFLIMGADRGTTIAFITSWLLLGINRALVWELPFLGSDFVLWRSLMSLPVPILAGLLARAMPLSGLINPKSVR